MTESAAQAQSTDSVLMIRPGRFYPNPETAADNAFQRDANRDLDALALVARNEFDAAVQTLRTAGVNVHVFEDTAELEKPDAIFPNNWMSTHHDGRIAHDFSYEPVIFTSIGSNGQSIYHTNVMMCIGTAFAMVGLDMIPNKAERQEVRARLEKTGKEIVELSADQIANFAGNSIELQNRRGEKLLVLSSRAAEALTGEQRERLTRYAELMQLEIPTIEIGGGSARCMLATIHLPPQL